MKLTQTVKKGGCAAKIAATELRQILSQVNFPPPHPELMVDGGLFDDAAIYKIHSELALVQTLDFFTPIVDSPRIFGEIAAANALSDVYAMGGLPKTALAILAFPLADFPQEVIVEVLQGASDKIKEAKANFVGGHSIDDDTLKFGLSVTGFVNPNHLWSNAKSIPGDLLILTKGLGTGTLTAALKRQVVTESEIEQGLKSMRQLNHAPELLTPLQHQAVHAATDITGFGLVGHCLQLATASRVSLEIEKSKLPILENALDFLSKAYLTKAHRTNLEYTKGQCDFTCLSEIEKLLVLDPQTSGGLLLSVDPNLAKDIVTKLKSHFPLVSVIGKVTPQQNKALSFVS